jgi:hypothetical protein
MSQKCGPPEEIQKIALSFFSDFSANFLAGKMCRFFSVKRKLFKLGSALKQLLFPSASLAVSSLSSDSHSTGVKPPKMFPSVSSMNVRVFAWPSQRS